MKVLFIGHYRERSGWGYAAINHILALDKAGVDVVPRCVKLGLNSPQLPERLLELEQKSSEGCDVCIQFVLPHLMDYNGRFKKNIGMYTTETDSFFYSGWPDKLNTMDELWISSYAMEMAAVKSGVEVPTKIVHYPADMSRFEKDIEPLDIPALRGNFVFYYVGDLNVRKNLLGFVKAFHLEFNPSEPVQLVMKLSKAGKSPQDLVNEVGEACNQIKQGLKLYKSVDDYIPEVLVTEELTDEQLAQLHVTCDCFVSCAYGEAWCLPAFDALGYGNPVITTDCGGVIEYVNSKYNNGVIVPYRREPVFGMQDTFNDLFTGYEQWASVDINKLRIAMRACYERTEEFKDMRDNARRSVYDFSYEKIGTHMKELLNNE